MALARTWRIDPLSRVQDQTLSQGAERRINAIDAAGVADVSKAVDFLCSGADAPSQFCRANVLIEHFVQQKNLCGEAGG